MCKDTRLSLSRPFLQTPQTTVSNLLQLLRQSRPSDCFLLEEGRCDSQSSPKDPNRKDGHASLRRLSSSVLCHDLLTVYHPSVIHLYLSCMLPIGLHASIIHLLSVYICHASVTCLSAICSPSIYSLIMHSSSIYVHERGVYYKELAHTILEAGSQDPSG